MKHIQLLQSCLLDHPAINLRLWEEEQMRGRGKQHEVLLFEKDTRH